MFFEKHLKLIGFRFRVPLFGKEGPGEICRGGSWRRVIFSRSLGEGEGEGTSAREMHRWAVRNAVSNTFPSVPIADETQIKLTGRLIIKRDE